MPLSNFGQAGDHVYRSAQPDLVGLEFLHQRLGVTVVVKLNTEEEASEPAFPGITVWLMPLGLHAPPDDHTRRIVEQIRQYSLAGETVLLHCTHGRDRTGFVVAAYQLLVMKWSLQVVLAERAAYGVDNPWAYLANHSFTEALERLAAARDAHAPPRGAPGVD